jgi:hypothetical protein
MPYVGGKLLTLRETADFLNVPEKTVRTEFRRGLAWHLGQVPSRRRVHGRVLRFAGRSIGGTL